MNYSPLVSHHIFYPVRLCGTNKSLQEGRGERGRKPFKDWRSIKCLTLVVGGFWVSWLQAGLLLWKGSSSSLLLPLSSSQREVFEGEFQMPTRKELTSSCRSAFFHIPFTLTRAESSAATVSQPGCRQPKKIIKLYRGQIDQSQGNE